MLTKAKFRYLKSLAQKKAREKEGVFLVEGWRSIEEAAGAGTKLELLLYTKEAREEPRFSSQFALALKCSNAAAEVSSREFGQIADTVTGQGIAAVVKKFGGDRESLIAPVLRRETAFAVALDEISDPGNLGAMVRSTDWFGADILFLSAGCVELYNPKVVRATAGSLFHLPIVSAAEDYDGFKVLFDRFRSAGFKIFGASVDGHTNLRSFQWPDKSVLVIGNEARGISPETARLLDETIAIPKFGKAESLNAGVAAGIFLAHASFQFRR